MKDSMKIEILEQIVRQAKSTEQDGDFGTTVKGILVGRGLVKYEEVWHDR